MDEQLITIDSEALDKVTGGGWLRTVGRYIPGVNAGLAVIDTVSNYNTARNGGKSVGRSVEYAAGEFIKDAVMWPLWKGAIGLSPAH